MTTLREAKQLLTDVRDTLLQDPEGVTWARLADQFKAEYGDQMLEEIGPALYDDWLRDNCGKLIKQAARQRSEQLTLPGMGRVDAFITAPDGEGGFRVKRLQYATLADLAADELIHENNVDVAVRARNDVVQRNQVLRPLMEEHGFITAGEAIDWLNQGADG